MIPSHIAFIPDGNRRWAKANHVPNSKAYSKGGMKFERILDWSMEKGISQVSAYILSSDNFSMRSSIELKEIYTAICDLMERWLKPGSIVDKYHVKVNFIGKIDILPKRLRDLISLMWKKTRGYRDRLINIMINYSGKEEIVNAVKSILSRLGSSKVTLTPRLIESGLGTKTPVDLIIRTGGMRRLSGFMTWQTGYSEMFVTKKMWPDFRKSDFNRAIDYYSGVKRNFGR